MWGVFEAHMKRLAQGEDGAMTLLRKGKHKEARTLLVQIHAMVSLVSGEHAEGVDAAHRVKELHDEVAVRPSALIARPVSACCCAPLPPHLLLPQLTVLPVRSQTVANDVIADKCDKAQSKVLDRPGPTKRDRWDWWMDIGVRDANFTDALWHLNSLLDLAHWLVTVSKGRIASTAGSTSRSSKRCRSTARIAPTTSSAGCTHVSTPSSAIASCQSQAADEAILQLSGDQSEEEAASVDNSEDGASEVALDDALDMRAAIKVACRELKEILQLLSRPASYAALFDATCDQAESTPRDSFHDLELLFQSMYMECQINFGDEETEPVVRQKALSCLFEFNRALPSDKAFEGYKKIFQSTYQHLYNQHQLAKKGELRAARQICQPRV